MEELADVLQQVAVADLGGEIEPRLLGLRPALRGLRRAYARGLPPSFEDHDTRIAYLLAYHPHHAALAAASFAAAGPQLLGIDSPGIRVAILGAGPAPELLGLVHYASGSLPDLNWIDAHLVDREIGWTRARSTAIDDALPRLWSGEVRRLDVIADLSNEEGLSGVTDLIGEVDLVIAQALITELPSPLGEGRIVDHLLSHLGPATRLMVIDFHKIPRFEGIISRIDSNADTITLLRARTSFAAARPLPVLREYLFANEDGLRARRELKALVQVLARPGAVRSAPVPAPGPELTDGQSDAVAAVADFLHSTARVFVLRGSAGTGKTTLFPRLVALAGRAGLPVALLAPTGQAARRLATHVGRSGSTIHSQIYAFARNEPGDSEHPPVACFEVEPAPDTAMVYLVDEASLIGDEPDSTEQRERSEVRFGDGRLLTDLAGYALRAPGSKLVLVGDPHQLPPVGEDWSPGLDEGRLTGLVGLAPRTAELTEPVRQREGSSVLKLAYELRTLASNQLPAIEQDLEAGVCLLSGGELPAWLADDVLRGASVVIAARNADVRAWNARLRATNSRSPDRPVVGDRLVLLRSDHRTGLVNGDELEVAEESDDVASVRLRDETVTLRRLGLRQHVPGAGIVTMEALVVDDLLGGANEADHRRVTKVLHVDFLVRTGLKPGTLEFDQASVTDERLHSLRLAYAYSRTCHRAQGGEWDHVVVDFGGSRAFGSHLGRWAYTAVTRARRAVWLANVPRATGPMGTIALSAAATQVLAGVGVSVVEITPIQHGTQLEITDGAARAKINLFEKRGLPSSVVATGAPSPEIQDRARGALERWIDDEQRAAEPPFPERLGRLAVEVAGIAAEQGYDIDVRAVADYQACFTIGAREASASILFHHGADGNLRGERAAEGDLLLLDTLRRLMAEALR
jgi:hypothetical protein